MSEVRNVSLPPRAADDASALWRAVQVRDARFDGAFVFGVRSTGIYCKPSCPARRPRRDRVSFFPTCEEAEQSGFRACLRCRPRRAPAGDPQVALVLRACRTLEARAPEVAVPLRDLGAQLGVSPHHLHRTFKNITGITPRQYASALRMDKFKSGVREVAGSVAGALYDCGYGSSSRLYEDAPRRLGMTPAAYRRGGKGMEITYTLTDCRLGRLLVAATGRGVCAVNFGDDDSFLETALRAEYPAAQLRRDEAALSESVNTILEHLEGAWPHPELPLDLRATAFQLRVWEELRKIPIGATRSYAEVAAAIGRPNATRAVAGACAANPVALLTPCHRVIRGDGQLGGYRWGVERKAKLLSQERERGRRQSDDQIASTQAAVAGD
ncbi:MAG: bifunctional DNA-binding transcriptional regulator/O6-methylguanine-DNA methyltransferase Ada [Pyrinomonadaceae bacterium]